MSTGGRAAVPGAVAGRCFLLASVFLAATVGTAPPVAGAAAGREGWQAAAGAAGGGGPASACAPRKLPLAGDGSYERWTPPMALAPPERGLLQAVRQWRHRRGDPLHYDWRLGRAAKTMLGWARTHAGEPFPLDALRAAAWAQGWTDGELAAVAVDGPRDSFLASLRQQLRATLGEGAALDRVGLASASEAPDGGADDGRRRTAVVAFSRRLVHLAPVARRVAPNGGVALSGRLGVPGVREVTVVARRPDGTSSRLVAAREGRRLSAHLPAGPRPGTLLVQLLVERGRGPEVAAEFPLLVGDAAAGMGAISPAALDAPGDAAATAGHHGSLLALLYGLRAAHDLSLPAPAPALMRVARAHAQDMAQHHFFAHASRRTGTVVDRLARAHQPFRHVVENIAEGPDVDQVFAQWLHSPGHRLNLLDPNVDAVGVAAVPGGPSAGTVAVLVMAGLPPGS